MTARTKKVVINVTALFTAIAGAVAWVAPRGAQIVDQRYVHADTFAYLRMRDSLTHVAEIHDIHRLLAGLDTAIRQARRGR